MELQISRADSVASNFSHDLESEIIRYSLIIQDSVQKIIEKNSASIISQIRSECNAAVAIASNTQKIVHDLKTPMSMLSLLLKMKDEKAANEFFLKFKPKLLNNLQYAESIISEIMVSGSLRPDKFEEISIGDILDSIMKRLSIDNLIFERNLIHRQKLFGDKIRIYRALSNLIQNCIEALPNKKNYKIWFWSKDDLNSIRIGVGNEGSYIYPEDVRLLFADFFTKGKANGTGLGLSIVKEIINNHSGDIECISDISSGTEFVITLPVLAYMK